MPKPAITRVNGGFQVAANTATNTKDNGLLVPQLTTAQRDGIPNKVNGTIIQNTTTKTFEIYATYVTGAGNVTAWLPLGVPVIPNADAAGFEAANTIPGQMYVNADNNQLKLFVAAWRTIVTAA